MKMQNILSDLVFLKITLVLVLLKCGDFSDMKWIWSESSKEYIFEEKKYEVMIRMNKWLEDEWCTAFA